MPYLSIDDDRIYTLDDKSLHSCVTVGYFMMLNVSVTETKETAVFYGIASNNFRKPQQLQPEQIIPDRRCGVLLFPQGNNRQFHLFLLEYSKAKVMLHMLNNCFICKSIICSWQQFKGLALICLQPRIIYFLISTVLYALPFIVGILIFQFSKY